MGNVQRILGGGGVSVLDLEHLDDGSDVPPEDVQITLPDPGEWRWRESGLRQRYLQAGHDATRLPAYLATPEVLEAWRLAAELQVSPELALAIFQRFVEADADRDGLITAGRACETLGLRRTPFARFLVSIMHTLPTPCRLRLGSFVAMVWNLVSWDDSSLIRFMVGLVDQDRRGSLDELRLRWMYCLVYGTYDLARVPGLDRAIRKCFTHADDEDDGAPSSLAVGRRKRTSVDGSGGGGGGGARGRPMSPSSPGSRPGSPGAPRRVRFVTIERFLALQARYPVLAEEAIRVRDRVRDVLDATVARKKIPPSPWASTDVLDRDLTWEEEADHDERLARKRAKELARGWPAAARPIPSRESLDRWSALVRERMERISFYRQVLEALAQEFGVDHVRTHLVPPIVGESPATRTGRSLMHAPGARLTLGPKDFPHSPRLPWHPQVPLGGVGAFTQLSPEQVRELLVHYAQVPPAPHQLDAETGVVVKKPTGPRAAHASARASLAAAQRRRRSSVGAGKFALDPALVGVGDIGSLDPHKPLARPGGGDRGGRGSPSKAGTKKPNRDGGDGSDDGGDDDEEDEDDDEEEDPPLSFDVDGITPRVTLREERLVRLAAIVDATRDRLPAAHPELPLFAAWARNHATLIAFYSIEFRVGVAMKERADAPVREAVRAARARSIEGLYRGNWDADQSRADNSGTRYGHGTGDSDLDVPSDDEDASSVSSGRTRRTDSVSDAGSDEEVAGAAKTAAGGARGSVAGGAASAAAAAAAGAAGPAGAAGGGVEGEREDDYLDSTESEDEKTVPGRRTGPVKALVPVRRVPGLVDELLHLPKAGEAFRMVHVERRRRRTPPPIPPPLKEIVKSLKTAVPSLRAGGFLRLLTSKAAKPASSSGATDAAKGAKTAGADAEAGAASAKKDGEGADGGGGGGGDDDDGGGDDEGAAGEGEMMVENVQDWNTPAAAEFMKSLLEYEVGRMEVKRFYADEYPSEMMVPLRRDLFRMEQRFARAALAVERTWDVEEEEQLRARTEAVEKELRIGFRNDRAVMEEIKRAAEKLQFLHNNWHLIHPGSTPRRVTLEEAKVLAEDERIEKARAEAERDVLDHYARLRRERDRIRTHIEAEVHRLITELRERPVTPDDAGATPRPKRTLPTGTPKAAGGRSPAARKAAALLAAATSPKPAADGGAGRGGGDDARDAATQKQRQKQRQAKTKGDDPPRGVSRG